MTIEPPVYIGSGSTVGADARLTGPVVIGHNCRIGDGATLRDVIVWPGTDVAPGSLVVGGIAASRPLAEKLTER